MPGADNLCPVCQTPFGVHQMAIGPDGGTAPVCPSGADRERLQKLTPRNRATAFTRSVIGRLAQATEDEVRLAAAMAPMEPPQPFEMKTAAYDYAGMPTEDGTAAAQRLLNRLRELDALATRAVQESRDIDEARRVQQEFQQVREAAIAASIKQNALRDRARQLQRPMGMDEEERNLLREKLEQQRKSLEEIGRKQQLEQLAQLFPTLGGAALETLPKAAPQVVPEYGPGDVMYFLPSAGQQRYAGISRSTAPESNSNPPAAPLAPGPTKRKYTLED